MKYDKEITAKVAKSIEYHERRNAGYGIIDYWMTIISNHVYDVMMHSDKAVDICDHVALNRLGKEIFDTLNEKYPVNNKGS